MSGNSFEIGAGRARLSGVDARAQRRRICRRLTLPRAVPQTQRPVQGLPAPTRVELLERDVTLSVLDFGGSGPPIVLSHANGFCAGLYAPVAEQLRKRHRVLAFDARGHGDSSVPPPPDAYAWEEFVGDLIALLETLASTLEDEPVYGIGHSFGGTVTLAAAGRRPELFSRIALIDPVLFPRPDGGWPARPPSGMGDIARKRRQVWPSRETARESWASRPPFENFTPRALDLYLGCGMRDRIDGQVELKCAAAVEASVFEHSSDLDPLALARALRRRGLLLYAARGSFPREFVAAVAAAAPELRLEEVDAGHLMPMEIPELVAEQLLRFGEPL